MCTILIADDDMNILLGLQKILKDHLTWPHRILLASDGQQALDSLLSTHIDLVIADIKMPSLDGISLLREIKEYRFPCEVLILSSYDDYAFIRDALKMDAFDYLLKPVNVRMLLQVLERMRESLRERDPRPALIPDATIKRPFPPPLLSVEFYDALPIDSSASSLDPSRCLQKALIFAAALEKDQTLQQLNSFFDAVIIKHLAPEEVRAALTQWGYSLMKANEGYIEIIGSSKLTPDDLLNCIKSLPTVSQLRTRCAQITSHYIERLQQRIRQKRSKTVKKTIEAINSTPAEELSLSSLAQRLYMTPNALGALFKAEMGVSFRSYRTASIVLRAKELLVHTDQSIADISEKLGYRDVAHFSRAFKKETGITPGKYRTTCPHLSDAETTEDQLL